MSVGSGIREVTRDPYLLNVDHVHKLLPCREILADDNLIFFNTDTGKAYPTDKDFKRIKSQSFTQKWMLSGYCHSY